MRLRFAVVRPEVGGYTFFFEYTDLKLFMRQVKDAPWFSRRVFANVR
jgi:hypothetical protein